MSLSFSNQHHDFIAVILAVEVVIIIIIPGQKCRHTDEDFLVHHEHMPRRRRVAAGPFYMASVTE